MSLLSMIRTLVFAVALGVGLLVTGMAGSVALGYVKADGVHQTDATIQHPNVTTEHNAIDVALSDTSLDHVTSPRSLRVSAEKAKTSILLLALLALEEADRRDAGQAASRPPILSDRLVWEQEDRPEDHLAKLYTSIPAEIALLAQPLNYGPSTISRIAIPAIRVDRTVAQVNIENVKVNGKLEPRWEVLPYDVGHHADTANPGQGGNIVLTGHSGGARYPFNELGWLKPGESIVLWSRDEKFGYTIDSVNIVDEEGPGVTLEQRLKNAEFILPTTSEMITMVTCWPLSDTPQAKKFTQRVIVRALPSTE